MRRIKNSENRRLSNTSPRLPRRQLIWLVPIILILVLALIVGLFRDTTSAPDVRIQSNEPNEPDPVESRLRLIATGDTIAHDAINQAAKRDDGTYEYLPMFSNMKELFDNADIRFCNQATLAGGAEYGVTGYPVFNAPTELSRDMAKLGCNVINTGSNHTNDYNQEVISASVEGWHGLPGVKAVAGANASSSDRQKVHYFQVKDIKFAFVSYTTYSNEPSPNGFSVTMYSSELARQQLSEARQRADIVIVSARWGTEYSPHVNADQKDLAIELANFGADIIFGHGPHVLQAAETIELDDGRETLVWYSLGNFFNAQLEPETLFNVIAVMDIDISSKKMESVSYLPIYMHYEWPAADQMTGNVLSRHNFNMYTFDDAQSWLDKSHNQTTLEQQQLRIDETLSQLMTIKSLTKNEYLQS